MLTDWGFTVVSVAAAIADWYAAGWAVAANLVGASEAINELGSFAVG